MPTVPLAEFAATFDRSLLQPKVEEAERLRRVLREKFPKESIATLPLERYASGLGEGTLCYEYEFGSVELGSIKGGSASKFLVFFNKANNAWKSTLRQEPDAHKAWELLRGGLVETMHRAADGRWDEMDPIPVARYIPALRAKMLHVFFPGEVLPIFAFSHLRHFMSELGLEWKQAKGAYTATANRHLLQHLRTLPSLSGWNTNEMAQLLLAWSPKTTNSNEVRVFKVAPGEDAMYWDTCLENGVMIIGWGETGDLSAATSLNDVKAAMQAAGYYADSRMSLTKKSKEVWNFISAKPGDIIAANRGTGQILALGTVSESGYEFISPAVVDNSDFTHCLHVEWDTSAAKQIPAQGEWAFKTVQELTGNLKRLVLDEALPPITPTSRPQSMSTALNQILYGPPGTGKTHRVIRDAARIVTGESSKLSYDVAVKQGRIRLATFHQSYSYEAFIEGIRPVMNERGTASFEIRDGIFKEIALDALFECLERNSQADEEQANYDDSASALPEPTQSPETDSKRPGREGPCRRVWEIADEAFEQGGSAPPSYVVVDAAVAEGIKLNTAKTQYSHWKKGHKEQIQKQSLASANQLSSLLSDISNGQTLSHKQKRNSVVAYLKLGSASGWQLRADKKYPPYVLVIDEINRGNISRIFGELITLIEDDKRHDKANALVVTLPSSRELFTVPPNLFLLGTMNTADKSLALLDVALRRRFEFNELAPDFSVCAGLPEEMRDVMEVMNQRLEVRKDRDHRIGHAFFIDVTDAAGFNRVFRRKVVPLLQEYFFNDIEGARYVLGEENSSDAKGFLRPLDGHSRWQRNRWRWFTDEEPEMDCWVKLSETLGIVEA